LAPLNWLGLCLSSRRSASLFPYFCPWSLRAFLSLLSVGLACWILGVGVRWLLFLLYRPCWSFSLLLFLRDEMKTDKEWVKQRESKVLKAISFPFI